MFRLKYVDIEHKTVKQRCKPGLWRNLSPIGLTGGLADPGDRSAPQRRGFSPFFAE
jgi:hypothetical protein